ncbi:MAG: hypothetical protein ACYCQI_13960 [Gammaproteobacteria bacterium]
MTTERVIIKDQCMQGYCKRMSWTAILVGALVGIGIDFLLSLFCIAIGLAVFKTTSDGAYAFALGGFLGLLISVIVAMFTAGMVAGYLARPYCFKRNLGVLYGFTTWTVALLLTVIFAASTSKFITSYTQYIYPSTTAAVVSVANNDTSPAVTANTQATPTEVTVNAQKATNDVGTAALIVFVLFFVGALSSCFGGHCGMLCRHDEREVTCSHIEKV